MGRRKTGWEDGGKTYEGRRRDGGKREYWENDMKGEGHDGMWGSDRLASLAHLPTAHCSRCTTRPRTDGSSISISDQEIYWEDNTREVKDKDGSS
jgi:hypothetical protein